MADGTRKPIKDVRIGDQVLATDPVTGETGPRPVTALVQGDGIKRLVDVTLETNGVSSAVTATDGHPFWVPELREWVTAGELTQGQWLQTSAGTWAQISAVRVRLESSLVYNLTVSDLHTYYVLAGDTSLLVHNCGSPSPGHLPPVYDPSRNRYLPPVSHKADTPSKSQMAGEAIEEESKKRRDAVSGMPGSLQKAADGPMAQPGHGSFEVIAVVALVVGKGYRKIKRWYHRVRR